MLFAVFPGKNGQKQMSHFTAQKKGRILGHVTRHVAHRREVGPGLAWLANLEEARDRGRV